MISNQHRLWFSPDSCPPFSQSSGGFLPSNSLKKSELSAGDVLHLFPEAAERHRTCRLRGCRNTYTLPAWLQRVR